ncbi:MAG: oligoendopeptidase, partial [Anaerolineae bacterium]|nr:oligoendopeptidase [Anaerolineae bacterium]
MTLNKNWDMDPIFPGGSEAPALADFLQHLADDLTTWNKTDLPATLDSNSEPEWIAAIEAADDLG